MAVPGSSVAPSESKSRNGKGCWYFITYHDCPVCGRLDETRERMYGPKPEKAEETHEQIEFYDYCEGM